MMMLSFFLRERTSITAPLWCSSRWARIRLVLKAEIDLTEGHNAARLQDGVARTALIELYMLKREGQGDGGIFIKGEHLAKRKFKEGGSGLDDRGVPVVSV